MRLFGKLTAPRGRRGAIAVAAVITLSACTASAVLDPTPPVDIGTRTAALPRAAAAYPGMQALVPSNPYMTGYPQFRPPMTQPRNLMPAAEADCRRRLHDLEVVYEDLAPIDDGGACRVDYPVKVHALSGGIRMQPAATLSCRMAVMFAAYTKRELAPAARTRYLSGIKAIHQGSSYSCRNIRGSRTASEHSKGNALDVMRIELNNGKDIDVRRPGFFAFREKSLLNNVRADACQYFTTVLGPGYDRDHADHFHFDIKARRNGYRACR